MFQVFQDDKPADCFGYPSCKDWKNSKFETLEDAIRYAYHWAYPLPEEEIDKLVRNYPLEVGVKHNLSMSEFPVIMEIRKCA